MRLAIKIGSVPAVVAALIVAVFIVTPEAITQILTLVQVFILTTGALFVLARLAPVAAWPRWRQRLTAWSVAVVAAVLVCLEPAVVFMLRR